MTITAAIIADSISPADVRLTTMELRYPRFIHAEFMTHRVFSRNASSSRAIPVERLIEDVLRDPAMPIHWGKNQPGMQAREQHDAPVGPWKLAAREAWMDACHAAIDMARHFTAAGYHKQIVNRLLEPFSHINVLVTATEWANFFALRRHEDAQPEIKALADAMWDAMDASESEALYHGEWHLPYVLPQEIAAHGGRTDPSGNLRLISTARAARVSYKTHEGKRPELRVDLDLAKRLIGSAPLHASPAEHQATPDRETNEGWSQPSLHGNLRGWIQHRKTLPNENITENAA